MSKPEENFNLQELAELRRQNAELKAIIENMESEQKKAEMELIKLSMTVEQSPVSVIVTDLDGNIAYANPKALAITGYTKEELIGKNTRIISSGEKSKNEYKKLWERISSGKDWIGEFQNKRKNGELFWESATISPIFNEKQEIINYVAVKEDITERKKFIDDLKTAKEIAVESEEKYRQLIGNIHVGIVVHAPDTSIILSNPEAERILGVSQKQLEGKNTKDPSWYFIDETGNGLIPDEYPVAKVISSHQTISNKTYGIKHLQTNNSMWVEVNAYPEYDIHNKLKQVVVTFIDITERKLAELALMAAKEKAEENEKKFSVAFHSSPSVNMISNIDTGEILETNDVIRLVTGFSKAEMIGNSTLKLKLWVIEGDREKFVDLLKRNKRVLNLESTFRKKSGELFIGLISGQMIQIQNRNCLLTSVHDITDRKNAEAELLKALEKVEESEEKYRNLYESLSISYIILKDGVCIDCNEATLPMYGIESKDEIIGKNPPDFSPEFQPNHKKSSEEAKRHIQAAIEKGVHTFEWITKRKNNEEFYSEVSLKTFYYKNEMYLQSLISDISERKRNESELIAAKELSDENELFLSTLINSLPDLVWLKDVNGVYLTCNKRFEEFIDFPKHKIIGKTDYDLMEADLADFFRKKDMEAVAAGKSLLNEEHKIFENNKYSAYVETIKTPFYRNGELVGVLGIGRNITERKNAELELRKTKEKVEESEEKFKNLYESLSISYLILKDGVCIECNEATLNIYGVDSKDEIIGKSPTDFSPEFQPNHLKSSEVANKQIEAAIEKGYHTFEWLALRKNKEKFYSEVSLKKYYHNNELYIQCLTSDITERKKNEAELIAAKETAEESESKFKNLYESLSIAYLILKDGVCIECNKAALEIYGIENKDEIIGKPPTDFSPEFQPNKTRSFDEAIRHNQIALEKGFHTFEWLAMRKNKELMYNEVSLKKFYYKNELHLQCLTTDITERKRIENDLIAAKEKAEENERKLLEANEIAKLGSWELDIETGAFTFTDSFYKIFQTTASEIGGYQVSLENYAKHFVHPEDASMVTEEIIKCFETLDSYRSHYIEHRFVYKNGNYGYIGVWFFIVIDESGKIIKTYGVNQDITERKLAELELIKAKEKAEESDRLKSAFLANMSHEIRTPMNGILGFTDLLLDPDLNSEEKESYINIVHKSGQRMLNTVNDIIEISRIEARLVEHRYEITDINNRVEELVQFFTPEAKSKGLKIILEKLLPVEKKNLFTDQNKLDSILTNLIKNAIKYTPEGTISIGCQLKKTDVGFYISDTGIGVPKHRQGAIFNRFEQADIEDKKVFEGSGLGLAIAKSYVEMLGGEIWVQSEEGKGSTFYFTLPVSKNSLEKPTINNETTPENNNAKIKELKIIIAEDDETSREYLSLLVHDFCREILQVETGNKTVELCRSNPDIDLILMDIQMQGMNGYEATRQIREFNNDVIIIAQTAFAISGDREKAIDAGCNDYITKPIDRSKLENLLQKYFG